MTPLEKSYSLPLSQGQVAIVDAEDFERLNRWKWNAGWSKTSKSFYAVRSVGKRSEKRYTIYMHREIAGLLPGDKKVVDHVNHDTLDNRRSNLRVCSSSENNCNSRKRRGAKSPLKGAIWDSRSQVWLSRIWFLGKMTRLGTFGTDVEAHEAYRRAAKELHPEFYFTA